MCVTNIYVDVYPDGQRAEFRQTSTCPYGLPGRPCERTSTLENPPRKILWSEPTTEFMLTSSQRIFPAVMAPMTPPRSAGGSIHRRSGGGYMSSTSDDGRRRDSKRRSAEPTKRSSPKPKREHRKERIIIVDSPPTPRTPPQQYTQAFTAPNSPVNRGRPIIVDERPRPPPRVPSVGAVVGDRPQRRNRSPSRPKFGWDSPSSSHTSFDLQSEEKQKADAKARRNSRIAELEAEKRREERIRAHDEDIKRRPAVPLPPAPLKHREFLRPVVDQSENLQGMMGGMRLDDRPRERVASGDRLLSSEARRRAEDRAVAAKLRVEAEEEEAMRQRLRERQMPGRRFSVGPAQRRQRVLYSDGVYRWE